MEKLRRTICEERRLLAPLIWDTLTGRCRTAPVTSTFNRCKDYDHHRLSLEDNSINSINYDDDVSSG
ncbi:MAG TPA: hypothetical protein VF692_13025 [Pyrinomonadaceae bacterium]